MSVNKNLKCIIIINVSNLRKNCILNRGFYLLIKYNHREYIDTPVNIKCTESFCQLSSMMQICNITLTTYVCVLFVIDNLSYLSRVHLTFQILFVVSYCGFYVGKLLYKYYFLHTFLFCVFSNLKKTRITSISLICEG